MYNQEQTIRLQKITADWISTLKSTGNTANNIDELKDLLRFHEYRYYVQNDPLIADTEYDILYKQLEKIEKENSALITVDSPTQRVGADPSRQSFSCACLWRRHCRPRHSAGLVPGAFVRAV